VQEEELDFIEMKNLLNIIIVKDLIPPFIPIKHIRTFSDMCKYFIFPFMATTSDN